MKNILFIFGFLALAHTGWSQTNEVSAVFAGGDCRIKTENELRYMHMQIIASQEMVDYMKQEAAKYEGYFVFELIQRINGTWDCKMGFNRVSYVQDFYKMFLALSIQKIEVEGKTYGSEKLMELCEK